MSIYKFQSFQSSKGYEWSETNTWTKEKTLTLHPVGDPTWNKLDSDKQIDLPEKVWSEYLKIGKGFMDDQGFMPKNPCDDAVEVFKKNVVKFADKYGFDKYVPHGSTLTDLAKEGAKGGNPQPTTIQNIAENISALMQFNHQYSHQFRSPPGGNKFGASPARDPPYSTCRGTLSERHQANVSLNNESDRMKDFITESNQPGMLTLCRIGRRVHLKHLIFHVRFLCGCPRN